MRQLTCADIAEQDLMARYVAGRLSDDDVEALESHYLTCAHCYTELRLTVGIRDTVPEARSTRVLELDIDAGHKAWGRARRIGLAGTRIPRRVTVGAAVALASAAVLTLMVLRPVHVTNTPTDIHRDERSNSTPVPQLQAPVGGVIAAGEFRWSPVAAADLYRVTLYDASSVVVWEGESPEPRVAFPAEIRLETGATYLWEVAARVDWNRWVRSSMAQFEIHER